MYKYTKFTEAKTLKEFYALEKAKFERGENPYNGEAISFFVDSEEKIEEVMKYVKERQENASDEKEYKSLENIEYVVKELKENKGKKIKDLGDITGIFEAIEITCEDLYYVIRKEDGKKVCSSCVGSIEIIE